MSPNIETEKPKVDSVREYMRLMRSLHALFREGKGDSPEAESVRDEMDPLWEDLDTPQLELLRGLSADLQWIIDGPVAPKLTREEAFQKYRPLFRNAWEKGDWSALLLHLRYLAPYFPAPELAFMRGQAWRRLGDDETAFLFYEHAHKLDPSNDTFAYLALECLSDIDRSQAIMRSEQILEDEINHPVAEVVLAATVLLSTVNDLAADNMPLLLEKLAAVFDRAVMRMTMKNEMREKPSIFSMACNHGGLCFARLGQDEPALELIDRGLAADPDNANLLVNRGIILYDMEQDHALADFRKAIENSSKSAWPYFFLALHAFCQKDFASCLDLANRALSLTTITEARVNLLNWIAICQFELGLPPDAVRACFTAALKLAPDNPILTHNLKAYETFLRQGRTSGEWEAGNVSRAVAQLEHCLLLN